MTNLLSSIAIDHAQKLWWAGPLKVLLLFVAVAVLYFMYCFIRHLLKLARNQQGS